jgi:hypothetical protein
MISLTYEGNLTLTIEIYIVYVNELFSFTLHSHIEMKSSISDSSTWYSTHAGSTARANQLISYLILYDLFK